MSQYKLKNNAVTFGELEIELTNEPAIKWEDRFIGKSLNESNMIMLPLLRHATDKEIQQVLRSSKTEFIQSKWIKTLGIIEPKLFATEGTYEKTIYAGKNHWLIHYQKRGYKGRFSKKPRPSIVGFVGSVGMLMAPSACILAGLAESEHDLIIVRRSHEDMHFLSNEFMLREIIDHLFSILGESLFETIALGTSAGGLAALCFGQMLQLPSSIAIGPSAKELNALHPIITSFLNTNNKYRNILEKNSALANKTIKICAAADNTKDATNAKTISNYLHENLAVMMNVRTYFYTGCNRHNCLEELWMKGIPLTKSLIPLII